MTPGKRALDVVAATVALTGFSPLMLALAVAIRLDDGGPVFFHQERVGRDGARFRIRKLRTMRDEEITRVGRWLRGTGLDEVPQFLHVLSGEMSVVGPRPLTREDLQRLGWADDAVRASLTPGITGPAQVFGAGAAESRRLDHRYAEEASLPVDVELIALSFAINVLGKARVRRWVRGHHRWGHQAGSSTVS